MKLTKLALLPVLGLLAGVAFVGGNKGVVEVRADASHGKDYGFVNFVNNPVINEVFPAGWANANVDTVFAQDSVSGLQWKVSAGFRSGGGDKLYLGSNDGTSEQDANKRSLFYLAEDDDEYAGMITAIDEQSDRYLYALTSVDYIEDITDLHFSFSAVDGYLYVLCQRSDDDPDVWHLMNCKGGTSFSCANYASVDTNGTWGDGGFGSFGWQYKIATNIDDDGARCPRARIAFVYWAYSQYSTLSINGLSINTGKAAKGFMDGLANQSWCTAIDTNYFKPCVEYFANTLSSAQNAYLQTTTITGDLAAATGYTNYYDFLSYVCEQCNVSIVNPVNSSRTYLFFKDNSAFVYVVLGATAITLISLLFVVLRKKRLAK